MALNLAMPKLGPELFAWRYTESGAAQTNHFVVACVREKVARRYDVVTFESLQLTP